MRNYELPRYILTLCTLLVLTAATGRATNAALEIDFANEPGSTLSFVGSTFSFNDEVPSNYNDFEITGVTNGVGDALTLKGDLDGTFTVGAITVFGPIETAPVSGSGALSIFDGTDALTATLAFSDIATIGRAGDVHLSGSVNISAIAYTGTTQDLIDLRDAGSAVLSISFTASRGSTLTTMTSGSATVGNYSGKIEAIPEPVSLAVWSLLLGLAMTAVPVTSRFRASA